MKSPSIDSSVSWGDPGQVATIPGWLVVGGASHTAVHVYALLSLHVGQAGPTKKDMAVTLGISDRAITKALDELVAVGAMAKTGSRGYQLLLTQGAAPEKPVPLPEIRTETIDRPPPIPRVEGRNLPLDVLCMACDFDERSPRIPAATAALNGRRGGDGITHLFWLECRRQADRSSGGLDALAMLHNDGERYAKLLAHQIGAKARQIKQKQPWRDNLTPQVIRDLWLDIEQMPIPDQSGRGMTPDEMRRLG